MKLKRNKTNKRALQLYQRVFGFRLPYQVLRTSYHAQSSHSMCLIVDGTLINEALTRSVDLADLVSRTLQGEAKLGRCISHHAFIRLH